MKESEKKSHILNSAKQLFTRFGLEKTTMDDIARAAKMGKSSLYYYFKSKEEVFAEVLKEAITTLQSRILKAIEKEKSPQGKLKKFIITRLQYLSEKGEEYVTVRDEYLRYYEFIEKLRVEYSQWEIDTLRQILDFGIQTKAFRNLDTKVVSKAFFFALKGLEYPWAVSLNSREINNNIEALTGILFEGINK